MMFLKPNFYKKSSLFFLFLLVLSLGCERPKGFTLNKILSDHTNHPKWEVAPLNTEEREELRSILSQPFTYLGSGNHCYAFESRDQNYVLKFFKQKHMKTKSLVDYLPIPAKRLFHPTQKGKRRQYEREKSYSSYKFAYDYLKKETGILFLHLNKTDNLNKNVELIDQNGQRLIVPIDEMEFLIQKKAVVGYKHLDTLFNRGDKESAYECITSLITIIHRRIEKGFLDRDLQFYKNFGFIDNQAVEIDIGEFRQNPIMPTALGMKEELLEVSSQLVEWVAVHHPEYESEVKQIIQDLINQVRD